MQLRGLVQAGRQTVQILSGSIVFVRLDWRSSPPFCSRSPFSSGLDLNLHMAMKSRWLEEEAVRCRGRVPQAWEMAQNGKQRGPCFLPEAQSSLKFYSMLWEDSSTGSAAKDSQGFGYVSVLRA
jgi:hypothetical protein